MKKITSTTETNVKEFYIINEVDDKNSFILVKFNYCKNHHFQIYIEFTERKKENAIKYGTGKSNSCTDVVLNACACAQQERNEKKR